MIDALPLLLGPEGYQISRSVRLRSSASAYFNRTPASATNRKTWTWSAWVKLGNFSSDFNLISARTGITAPLGLLRIYSATNGYTINYAARDSSNVIIADISTNAVFRDPSSWYHIVVSLDTTQATSSDRYKVYVNGVSQSLTTSTAATLNSEGAINGVYEHNIGKQAASAVYADGYLTEINFIDGQALTPSSFGETDAVTGVWRPKKYTGTYGTNGFYLNFSDNSNNTAATIGKDSSGNGNNWTPNNISVTAGATYDSMLDVPTPWGDGGNGRGNYAVLNPLNTYSASFISNANLRFQNTNAYWANTRSTIQPQIGGKYYVEFTSTQSYTVNNVNYIGLCTPSMSLSASSGDIANIYNNTTSGEVLALAIDRVNNQVSYYRNNSLVSTASISATSDMDVVVGAYSSNGDINFGQRPFAYTPPTGFKALNTFNLPVPTIANGANYFAATTYTGTGASRSVDNTVNNVSFQPDFVWVKGRSGATDHALYDAVRGVQLQLESNTTAAETTETTGLTAFNSNGFTVGALAQMNTNTATYVAWQWKEGATQGFDIVTYTGNGANRTIAHNLGVAPSMLIVKNRTGAANDWYVWHTGLTSGAFYINLNATGAQASAATVWNSTVPTSTVFSLGTSGSANANGTNYVAYLFAEVAGFSRFGSYTGNGSADGPFVFCGFRPKFVLWKRTDTGGYNWNLYDTSRSPYNLMDLPLAPNISDAESVSTSNVLDGLSNGFKVRGTSVASNANGGTYIYAAFAEVPFRNALAR